MRILPAIAFLGFIGIIDTSMISPIIANYATSLGASKAIAGFIAGLYSIIAIISSIPLGFLTDKLGRRKLLLLGIPLDILAFLIYFLAQSYVILIFARALHAIFDSVILPSTIAIVGDQLRQRGFPLSVFWSMTALTIAIGASLTSYLTLNFGFKSVFLFLMLTHLIAFLVVYSLRIKDVFGSTASKAFSSIKLNLRYLIPPFFVMFSLYIMNGVLTGALGNSLKLAFNLDDRTAAAQVGMFLAISTITSIPFFFLASRMTEKRGPKDSLLISSVLTLITSIILYSTLNSVLYFDISFLLFSVYLYSAAIIFGIALSFGFLTSSYITASMGEEARGTATGILQSFSLLGVALGAPLAGLTLENFGYSLPFLLPVLPLIISLFLSLRYSYAEKR